ncbi:MAG TPA: PP2C family protein-serine/threonine phosphatase [Acidimicrobiales bacterium]|nr:PP2C family protein-serine/threonine phosphatase [Acidimicrobiales bacterium]
MSIEQAPERAIGKTEIADGTTESARPAWHRHGLAAVVLMVGLLATAALTLTSANSYRNNERKLTRLQIRLTGSILQTAQPQLEGTLGRIVGLAAGATDPASTFGSVIQDQLMPKGTLTSASLILVANGQAQVIDHVGAARLAGTASQSFTDLYLRAASSTTLITARVVSGNLQRLGYLLSAKGPAGVYVVAAAQQLPLGDQVQVPAGSPDSNLNFALYFGSQADPANLIETNVGRLPLHGTTASTMVPFGNNELTFVASPKRSLVGAWSEYLPWAILGGGILLSLGAAGLTERLVRRRLQAERLAAANEVLYQQQRGFSETLQRSLLPRRMPDIAGFDFAYRYVPATEGAEIGGDWYSVVEIDDRRFAVVVGDVSGHDIVAAGTMASLRYTIRTLAALGFSPDEILYRTGKEMEMDSDDQLATVLVGVVDVEARQVTLASAGHPPPLLVSEDKVVFVPIVPGAPLGTPADRPQLITIDFPAGSTLVAFTDGLIERRGEGLGAGLDRLAAAAGRAPAASEELITHLVDDLAASRQEDDIAVLAVRFVGTEVPVGARPGSERVP